jgi:hypothetical protein
MTYYFNKNYSVKKLVIFSMVSQPKHKALNFVKDLN